MGIESHLLPVLTLEAVEAFLAVVVAVALAVTNPTGVVAAGFLLIA